MVINGAGESYVVFGGSGVGSTGSINLSGLSGTDGFVLNGVDANDRSGYQSVEQETSMAMAWLI